MSFAYRATRSTRRGLAAGTRRPARGVAAAGVVALSLAGLVAGLPGAQAVGADLGASSVAPVRPSAGPSSGPSTSGIVEVTRVEGEDAGAMNNAFSGAVNTMALLSALTQQATKGVSQREQSLQSATGQIGSAEDVKGSVDANTRMQLETARTINELIGVSNGAVSALNTEMQMRLTQQSETAKMLQYKDINPFK